MHRTRFCRGGGLGPNVHEMEEKGEGRVSSRKGTRMRRRKKPKSEGHLKVTNSQNRECCVDSRKLYRYNNYKMFIYVFLSWHKDGSSINMC